jgi:hypothetical protein
MNDNISPTEPSLALSDGYTIIPARESSAPLRDLVYAHHLGMPANGSTPGAQEEAPRPTRSSRRQRGSRTQRKR